MTDARLPCGHGWSRPERADCPYCDNEKLRAELERAYGELATRGNEVLRLRTFMGAEMLAYYDKLADGGQKTSEASVRPDLGSGLTGQAAVGRRPHTPDATPAGAPKEPALSPAIPPRAASGGEAPERIGLCVFTDFDGSDMHTRVWKHNDHEGLIPRRKRVDYVRADIADDLLAALRAVFQQDWAPALAIIASLDAGRDAGAR
jgi:hypothetical protein